MQKQYRVLGLGASYGSLLAIKLVLAGHKMRLVCLPNEVEVINAEGIRVRLRTDVEAEAAAADIGRRLVLAGLAIRRLEPARASLEQRFLEITSRLEEAA